MATVNGFNWGAFNQSVKKSAAKKGKARKPKTGSTKGKAKKPAGGGSL